MAHIAYQIQFLPIVNNFLFSVLLSPSISANIVIYSNTLFLLFKTVYILIEIVIYIKIITYIILAFKEIDFKDTKASLLKPILGSIIVSITLYFLPMINNYIFSILTPKADSTNIVYSIPLFHFFQVLLFLPGIILSFFCLYRILKRYKASNTKGNRLILTSHFLFMSLYSFIILFLLVL